MAYGTRAKLVSSSVEYIISSILTRVCRYIPPQLNPDKSNPKNSENTALFLVSCFEYVFIGVVLSAGKPFRQPMNQNCKFSDYFTCLGALLIIRVYIGPFMITILAALALNLYMVFVPAHGFRKFMQLTNISSSFKVTLLVLGVTYLVVAWIGENYVFQKLARGLGQAKLAITKQPKKRKEYKVILERMKI